MRTDRFDTVGSWFLEANELREWRSAEGGADKAVLFCYGNPGVGKTFLRSATSPMEEGGVITDGWQY